MFDQNEFKLAQQRHEALRQQQNEERRPADKPPFYAPALASLGKKMSETGANLQERYGELLQEQPTKGRHQASI